MVILEKGMSNVSDNFNIIFFPIQISRVIYIYIYIYIYIVNHASVVGWSRPWISKGSEFESALHQISTARGHRDFRIFFPGNGLPFIYIYIYIYIYICVYCIPWCRLSLHSFGETRMFVTFFFLGKMLSS